MFKQPYNILLATAAFLIWAGLIILCYINNFSFSGNQENFVFDEILISIVLIFISLLSGNRLFKFFRFKDISVLEEILFSLGVGMALFSVAVFILGLLKILYFWTLILLLVGFALVTVSNYDFGKILWIKTKNWHPNLSLPELFLLLFIFVFAGLTLMNTLTPPVSRDALIHHLAIPKLYIKHHGIINIPFASPSYYPPFMEMLYAGALLLSSDILAKLLHFFFFLGSLLFTYALGKRFLSRPMSLLAVLLFGSLPVVCQVSSIAYSDLGLTFYTIGGFFALFRWFQTRLNEWFWLGALMTGCAIGCKYNGLIILFSFVVIILLILVQRKLSLKSLAKNIFLFLFLVFMVNSLVMQKLLFYWQPGLPFGKQYYRKTMVA